MSALQSVEAFVDWLAKAFGDKREQADVAAGEAILAFWQSPSPATKASMVTAVQAAIAANASAVAPSPPAASPSEYIQQPSIIFTPGGREIPTDGGATS